MASLGFAQWATGVRNRMANDPGRTDFRDQVQCHGHLFLHEYLDDLLNAPRPENVIEFAKTPGRNKTTSKRTRAANASAQKLKPVMPLTFPVQPADKENISDASPKPPPKNSSRLQHTLFTARETSDTPHTRDSIARATFPRPGVPIFSPSAPAPTRAPLEDPTSPFHDKKSPAAAPPPQPQQTTVTQQIFTTKLTIQPSSPVQEHAPLVVEEPVPAMTAAAESQPTEVDLSVIQEDDEGNSSVFQDAREEFTGPAPLRQADEQEADITELAGQADEPSAPAVSQPEQPPKAASSPGPTRTAPGSTSVKSISSPVVRPPTPAQRLPSPPASEDTPAPTPKPSSPVKEAEPEPAPTPVPEAEQAIEPTSSEPTTAAQPSAQNQPTPPPEPTVVAPPPVVQNPIPPVVPAQAQTRPPNAGRGFTGPSLKELRREPSVSGAAHRELRQSSWRKKPDGAPAPAPVDDANKLKRKSSVLVKPGVSKHPRRESSYSSSDEDNVEMQVPLKDEDSTGGSNWNSGGGSMLDDLRSRLARLEKSTSGKTPAPSRTLAGTSTSLPPNDDERRMSISDLGLAKPRLLAFSSSTTTQVDESILSNRTTTPENSPPPAVRKPLLAPPVFVLPNEPAPPAKPLATVPSSDAVRAAAKADAARFFAGTKLAPSKVETQSTISTEQQSVFDSQSRIPGQWSQDDEGDMDEDVDVVGTSEDEAEEDTKASDNASSFASSTTQTRSAVKKGPVKSIQLAAAAAKKAAEEQDRKTTRMKEMEERRQAAALRKAEEDKAKANELEKKRKEREELAASKSVKASVKKVPEDPNKKRKVEPEKKPVETKKPMASSVFKDTAATKSRIAKPTPGPSGSSSQPPQLKSAMKPPANPFTPAPKTIKHVGSSSSLKSTSNLGKKAKGSISDTPGQALQAQMQARVQAQIKATQKEPEIQSESIELPDINSEYSDSEDEDRGKDFPDWTQSPELMQALKDQETFNPDAIFGPIQPLKMGDLFRTGHARFRKRTSSANWAGTDGITREEEIEYARRMGYKN